MAPSTSWKPSAESILKMLISNQNAKKFLDKTSKDTQWIHGRTLNQVKQDLDKGKIPSAEDFVADVREVFVGWIQTHLDSDRETAKGRRMAFVLLDKFSDQIKQHFQMELKMALNHHGTCRDAVDKLMTELHANSQKYTVSVSILTYPEDNSNLWLGGLIEDVEFEALTSVEAFGNQLRKMFFNIFHKAGDAVIPQLVALDASCTMNLRLEKLTVENFKDMAAQSAAVVAVVSSPVAEASPAIAKEEDKVEVHEEVVPAVIEPEMKVSTEEEPKEVLMKKEEEEVHVDEPLTRETSPPPATAPKPSKKAKKKSASKSSKKKTKVIEEEEENDGNDDDDEAKEDQEVPAALPLASKEIREENDDVPEFYTKPLTKELRSILVDQVSKLFSHPLSEWFRKPVNVKDYPDYTTMIKNPMDLTTLKHRIPRMRTLQDFFRDAALIRTNCLTFNSDKFEANKPIRDTVTKFDRIMMKAVKSAVDAHEVKVQASLKPSPPPPVKSAPVKPVFVMPTLDVDLSLKLTPDLKKIVGEMVKKLEKSAHAREFLKPVDWEGLGLLDYPKVCPRPMDLKTLSKKLDTSHKILQHFVEDANLIWQNCRTFNAHEDSYIKIANECEALFIKELNAAVFKYTDKQDAMRKAKEKIFVSDCADPATGHFKFPFAKNNSEFGFNPLEEKIRDILSSLVSVEQAKLYFGFPVLQHEVVSENVGGKLVVVMEERDGKMVPKETEYAKQYKELVSHPMDLQTICVKLFHHKYANDAESVNHDVELIFSNAAKANPLSTDILQAVKHCQLIWQHLWVDMFGTEAEKKEHVSVRNAVVFPAYAQKGKYAHILRKLMTKEMQKGDAKEFLVEVYSDSFVLADYRQIILNPRDLTTISKKVEADDYETYGEFVADVKLCFDNCLLYNSGPGEVNDALRESAHRMHAHFDHFWNKGSVMIFEYVLRKQAAEEKKRLELGDAYVPEPRKPRGRRQQQEESATTTRTGGYLESDEENHHEDDDEADEVVVKKSRKSDHAAGGGGGVRKHKRESKAHLPSVHVMSTSAMTNTTTTLTDGSFMDDGHVMDDADMNHFERESQVQLLARREALRLHRAEVKKRRATLRKLQRDTSVQVLDNVRTEALLRFQHKQQHHQATTSSSPAPTSPSHHVPSLQEFGEEGDEEYQVSPFVSTIAPPAKKKLKPCASIFTCQEDVKQFPESIDSLVPFHGSRISSIPELPSLTPSPPPTKHSVLTFPVDAPVTIRPHLVFRKFEKVTLWTFLGVITEESAAVVTLQPPLLSLQVSMNETALMLSKCQFQDLARALDFAFTEEWGLAREDFLFLVSQPVLHASRSEYMRLSFLTPVEITLSLTLNGSNHVSAREEIMV